MSTSSESRYVVRLSWEGDLIAETPHVHEDDAERDFTTRVRWYLNLPDVTRALGTVLQVIEVASDRVLHETVI